MHISQQSMWNNLTKIMLLTGVNQDIIDLHLAHLASLTGTY